MYGPEMLSQVGINSQEDINNLGIEDSMKNILDVVLTGAGLLATWAMDLTGWSRMYAADSGLWLATTGAASMGAGLAAAGITSLLAWAAQSGNMSNNLSAEVWANYTKSWINAIDSWLWSDSLAGGWMSFAERWDQIR